MGVQGVINSIKTLEQFFKHETFELGNYHALFTTEMTIILYYYFMG